MDRYADKLSEGQQALLRAYPESWYLNVYPTRRSAAYPDFVYAAAKTNAREAELISEGLGGVRDARITSPFPIPRQGVEVIWNHNLRWRGIRVHRINGRTAVTRLGNFRMVLLEEEVAFPYGLPTRSWLVEKYPQISIAVKQKILSPGRVTGFGQLVLESSDYTVQARQSWVYNPSLRRVLRQPFNGFDNPSPQTDGLRLQDEFDMYNGSPALFDWKLLGKRELYIPYNAYALHSDQLTYRDILHKRHINPALARYELHRVWVVEGTVRSARRNPTTLNPERRGHIYSRRVFYIDEDSWQLAVADNYDREGQLWRFSEGHPINYYEVPVFWYDLQANYDFRARRYVVSGLDNRRDTYQFTDDINPNKFSPIALEYYVR